MAIKILIAKGANMFVTDNYKNTVMHAAVSSGNQSLVKFLLELGVSAIEKNLAGRPPLFKAVSAGYNEIVCLLLATKAVRIDDQDCLGETALMFAVFNNRLEIASNLIAKGLEINLMSKRGFSALNTAVYAKLMQMTELLITNGADINMKDGNGCPPIHTAVFGKNLQMVTMIVTSGAPI